MTAEERIEELRRRTGEPLRDAKRAREALCHKSWANELGPEVPRVDNERLEFLGDAVIDLAISHRLMERFPGATEGVLSKARATVVSEAGLSAVARELGLGDLVWLGKGEELTGGRAKASVLADALEAVVAAVYLDGGMEGVLRFVDRHFAVALQRVVEGRVDRDYKTRVQELAQGAFKMSPRYRLLSVNGPDHARAYTVALVIGEKPYGEGTGTSKKDAEQAAAEAALRVLEAELSRA